MFRACLIKKEKEFLFLRLIFKLKLELYKHLLNALLINLQILNLLNLVDWQF